MKAYLKAILVDDGGSSPNTHSAEGAALGRRISSLLKKGELD